MEENNRPNNEFVKLKVSELIKKFKTKRNIYDFCRENSKYIY